MERPKCQGASHPTRKVGCRHLAVLPAVALHLPGHTGKKAARSAENAPGLNRRPSPKSPGCDTRAILAVPASALLRRHSVESPWHGGEHLIVERVRRLTHGPSDFDHLVLKSEDTFARVRSLDGRVSQY